MDRFDSVNDTPNYQESDKLNHTFDTQVGSMYNVSKAIAQQDKFIDEIDTRKGYSKTETDDLLNTKADADDVYTKTETYNQTEIDDLLSDKADADDVYTKTETYNQTEIDDLLSTKADADDVYTKTESVNLLLDKVYPVGSIYMSVENTSPASFLGGTWEQLKDRFLLGAGDTYTNGTTGGNKDAVVVSHYHHIKNNATGNSVGVGYGNAGYDRIEDVTFNATIGQELIAQTTGESGTNKNMPPYLVVYMWKRTA